MSEATKNLDKKIKNDIVIFKKRSLSEVIKKDFQKNYELYLLLIPVLLYYLIFCYKPMYGVLMAFTENFSPNKGVLGGKFVGFKHFIDFFNGMYFQRTLGNTLIISISTLIFGFPAPIILALLMNELRSKYFSRIVQTVTYLPHFISLVVICGMISIFTSDRGFIGQFVNSITNDTRSLLNVKEYFVPIYVISDIWQGVGWGSIIYLAALTGIESEQYEAAAIDGASRWKQMLHITIPGILPTVVIMLILRMGGIINVGFEKIILLYNGLTMESADVISTYVYRRGLIELQYSFSAAVGLFNSIVNFMFIIGSNWISKKLNQSGIW